MKEGWLDLQPESGIESVARDAAAACSQVTEVRLDQETFQCARGRVEIGVRGTDARSEWATTLLHC